MASARSLIADLQAAMPAGRAIAPEPRHLEDASRVRGLRGRADAVAIPRDADEVAAVVAWCYRNGVAVIPRGGGTGYAGGAVPIDGGVVLSLEALRSVRSFDPQLWRIEVEAGLRTAELRRLARENGLLFPPDPGALEQSQIGGNVATNAGGPHSFKYGVTGRWVTGIEAVVAPGELVTLGGALRKDQAGYDLKSLLIGSEGTLGVVTSVWLRLTPAPERAYPVLAATRSRAAGCALVEQIVGLGIEPAALEFVDAVVLGAAAGGAPIAATPETFLVLAEADGSVAAAEATRTALIEAATASGAEVVAPRDAAAIAALWRWREGLSLAVAALVGGKVGEDVVVPLDRLAELLDGVERIAADHRLQAASWGHAGDGNVHANFLVDLDDPAQLARAEAAAGDLFALAIELGGSISGEHGVGWLKRGHLERGWGARAQALHEGVKAAFDPRGLLNPGKKR
jgi:glycolate oxidase subunit GlcD